MTSELWICAYFNTLVPGVKDRRTVDCPNAGFVSHRHIPPEAPLERCGWYRLDWLEADDEQ